MQDYDDTVDQNLIHDKILSNISKVEKIRQRAKPHLRSQAYCVVTEHTKEHHAFQLYLSFLTATICQGVLQKRAPLYQDPDHEKIVSIAKRSITSAAEAFLDLHRLSIVPLRSWSAIHCGIGSALLLGILAQLDPSEEFLRLQHLLVDALPNPKASLDLAGLSIQHQRALDVLNQRRQDAPIDGGAFNGNHPSADAPVANASRDGANAMHDTSADHSLFTNR